MTKCDVKIYVEPLKKHKLCFRNSGHKGSHSPDLLGEFFGDIYVKKLGRPYLRKSGTTKTIWVIEHRGFEKEVLAESLTSQANLGVRVQAGYSSKNGRMRPEYATVASHFKSIFGHNPSDKSYWGMPFFDGWNPNKGGSYQAGAKWIIENLGEKPGPEYSLDIIKHEIGFMPGNMRWVGREIQSANRRRLVRFSDEQLISEIEKRGFVVIKAHKPEDLYGSQK